MIILFSPYIDSSRARNCHSNAFYSITQLQRLKPFSSFFFLCFVFYGVHKSKDEAINYLTVQVFLRVYCHFEVFPPFPRLWNALESPLEKQKQKKEEIAGESVPTGEENRSKRYAYIYMRQKKEENLSGIFLSRRCIQRFAKLRYTWHVDDVVLSLFWDPTQLQVRSVFLAFGPLAGLTGKAMSTTHF